MPLRRCGYIYCLRRERNKKLILVCGTAEIFSIEKFVWIFVCQRFFPCSHDIFAIVHKTHAYYTYFLPFDNFFFSFFFSIQQQQQQGSMCLLLQRFYLCLLVRQFSGGGWIFRQKKLKKEIEKKVPNWKWKGTKKKWEKKRENGNSNTTCLNHRRCIIVWCKQDGDRQR